MEADFKIIFKMGKYFLAERYDLCSEPKYKHICWFVGINKGECYSYLFKLL